MIAIVMGVVGAGKTTVGKLLASQLGWEFADADDFHPQSNVKKIRHGIALTDEDREPWLDCLREAIVRWIAEGKSVILACSALKRSYRAKLCVGPQVRFVYLKGSAALIADRLHSRHGHFAGESILASQLADLEEPEKAITVDITGTPEQIAAEIKRALAME
ncbi:MAG TPA: gluconokinase [Terriglobales bacterium]|jgi:gluconokinase|nr:gluconokinase [Terriglobales bacterium]